ncbi:MAG: AAA family ATPase, partial [Pseudonocardiaceae bacterium]
MDLTWPFVGREDESQFIRDAMTTGTGVVLAGAPGVGKTRLAHEAVVGADPRWHVTLWAAATSATMPIPLGALAPLLPADLPTSPIALLRAATDALLDRCGTRRLVLGIDDAHLLDEMSAALVYQLARTRRAFVLAGLRSRHAVPDPIRALWKDGLATRVEIEALSPAGTADVLAAALGGQVDGLTSRRLCRVARGDMLFLQELVHGGLHGGALTEVAGVWCWEGPWVTTPRLVELVSARIGRLARWEQEVLEIVAYGEPIGADLLTSLVGRPAVEAMESRELLRADKEGRRVDVQLAHPLYGEVLRAGCSPQRAAALRHRLADAVEATGTRRKDDWLRIATWRLDASAPVRPDVLVTAAHQAFARLDLPLVERLARTAFDACGDPAAGAVLWRVLLLSQRCAETEELMARLAGTVRSDSQRGDYAIGRAANLFWGLRRIDEAHALLRAIREVIDDPVWLDEIDLFECVFQLLQANLGTARRGLAKLQARRRLSPRTAAQVPVVQGMALVHLGRLGLAREVLELAAEPLSRWAEEIPWVSETRRAYQCYAALFAGRLREADELATTFHTHALQTEWAFALQLACSVQAQVARLRGRVRTAARWAREGLRRYRLRLDGPFQNYVLGELAHAEALVGNGTAAVAAMQDADRGPAPSEALLQPWT